MKITREWIIGGIVWLFVIAAVIFMVPYAVGLYNRPDKPKPLPLEQFKIDKDLTFFHQPVYDTRFARPTCWYQIHGLQGKSGANQFSIECELYARLKTRLTPPKMQQNATASRDHPLAPSL